MRQGGSYIKEKGKDPVLAERTGMEAVTVKKAGLKVVKTSDKPPVKNESDSEENKS